MDDDALIAEAKRVLKLNDLGGWTRPTATLYPHQWLWDSCFTAIGLRQYDVRRAQQEIRTLLEGQWKNGMVPFIRFSDATTYHAGPELWRSDVSPDCPPDVRTTGVSQPPMITEAVVQIGAKLAPAKRLAWYREMYPALARYHEWWYRDRDLERSGLVTVVHSWETGLDNNPAWMEILHRHALSPKLRTLDKSKTLIKLLEMRRRDTSVVPAKQRMSTLDLMAFYDQVRSLRRMRYDDARIMRRHKLLIKDLVINSVLIHATHLLGGIADEIGEKLPPHTAQARTRGADVLERLWHEEDGVYYNLDTRTGQLVRVLCHASIIPLYAGTLPEARVQALLRHVHDPEEFATPYPMASAPLNSSYFNPQRYWQGPSWMMTNWLLWQGYLRNGCDEEAETLRRASLRMIRDNGMHEYYSPIDGKPAGAPDFAFSAALALDMLAAERRIAS